MTATSFEGSSRRRVLGGLVTLVGAATIPRWAFTASATTAFFTSAESAFITAFADTLIPKTDTPGAVEAGVPGGFDQLLTSWASGARRAAIKQAIEALRVHLDERAGEPFVSASPATRLSALTALDADAYGAEHERYEDYRDIKVLMVRLYYASEPGATLELRYDPVPGGYDGDVPFAKIGRTWADVDLGGSLD
jgi:gluconate 2-dehydrogenase gamma chain